MIRTKLWDADPRCHWCSTPTLKYAKGRAYHPDVVTLDHIKPRWQCQSLEEYSSPANHVIACRECNMLRDKIDQMREGIPEKQSKACHQAKEAERRKREAVTGRHIERILEPPAWERITA